MNVDFHRWQSTFTMTSVFTVTCHMSKDIQQSKSRKSFNTQPNIKFFKFWTRFLFSLNNFYSWLFFIVNKTTIRLTLQSGFQQRTWVKLTQDMMLWFKQFLVLFNFGCSNLAKHALKLASTTKQSQQHFGSSPENLNSNRLQLAIYGLALILLYGNFIACITRMEKYPISNYY